MKTHLDVLKECEDLARQNITNLQFMHNDVCFMLNFGGLTQEKATEMSKHYNELIRLFREYRMKATGDIIDWKEMQKRNGSEN